MGSDLIYGQNDSFVLAWVVLSLWLWFRGAAGSGAGGSWIWASAAVFGLGMRQQAHRLVPGAVLPAADYRRVIRPICGAGRVTWLAQAWRAAWPALAAMALVIGPFLIWDPGAMVDDVWRWSNGTSDTAYQIWGWGASNLVLALGWVQSRFDYWPFWLPQLAISLPCCWSCCGGRCATTRLDVRCGATGSSCWSSSSFPASSTRTTWAISWLA